MVVAFSAHNWGNTTLTHEIITTQFQLGTWLNSFFLGETCIIYKYSPSLLFITPSAQGNYLEMLKKYLPWGGVTYYCVSTPTGSICLVRSELVVGRGSHWGHVTSAPGWPRSPQVATRCRAPVQEQATNINHLVMGRTAGRGKRDAVTGMVKVRLMGKMMEIVLSPHWRV